MSETQRLMRAVQALAQPADVQCELFPDFVAVGDELALDFEETFAPFIHRHGHELTVGQRLALDALDTELERLSGPANEDFWLDPRSLEKDPAWRGIRFLAMEVLRELGWPHVRPDPSDAVYIGPPE